MNSKQQHTIPIMKSIVTSEETQLMRRDLKISEGSVTKLNMKLNHIAQEYSSK